MFKVLIKDKFESAHFLTHYYEDGSDEPIHGHTFYVEVILQSKNLKNGISLDFIPWEKKLKTIVEKLDHCLLNDLPFFKESDPTAENIALFVYQHIEECEDSSLQSGDQIAEVKVWEGPDHYASYVPN